MATAGTIGYGAKLYIGDEASPLVYTAIGEIYDFGPVGQESSLVDFTNHDSPNRTKEFLKGLREGNLVSFACNRVDNDTGQDAIKTAEAATGPYDFRAEFPTGAGGTEFAYFEALVTKYELAPNLEDRFEFRFDVKITGNVLWS